MTLLDQFQQLRAIHLWHAHIGDHSVERLLFEGQQRGRGAIDELHFPVTTHAMQGAPQAVENVGFVIDKEQPFGHQSSFARWIGPIGKLMKKVVPWPSSVSNQIFPPCFLTITACARDRPCPVPLPTSLVVKNGSKTLVRIASGMPVPVSATEISANSPRIPVQTVIFPFSPLLVLSFMACAAFTNRFRMTWFTSPG